MDDDGYDRAQDKTSPVLLGGSAKKVANRNLIMSVTPMSRSKRKRRESSSFRLNKRIMQHTKP